MSAPSARRVAYDPRPSTSSAEASLAKTSPTPKELDSTAPEADSGSKCSAWFASYDPASSSWKTSQLSLFAASTASSLDLPPAGTMRSGQLCDRAILASPTGEPAHSCWPTPIQTDESLSRRKGYTSAGHDGTTFTDAVIEFLGLATTREPGQRTEAQAGPNPVFVEALMGFPRGWTDVD